MKLTEMFPSNLLKAQDVTDAGGEMPLTIKDVQIKEFDGDNGKERKPVIFFDNDKQMVCNKTNGEAIAKLHGNDSDLWIGKDIILVVQEVPFGNKTVPAIRIKNLNSKESAVQEFWRKVNEIGLTRQEGLDILKDTNQDFVAARKTLDAPY